MKLTERKMLPIEEYVLGNCFIETQSFIILKRLGNIFISDTAKCIYNNMEHCYNMYSTTDLATMTTIFNNAQLYTELTDFIDFNNFMIHVQTLYKMYLTEKIRTTAIEIKNPDVAREEITKLAGLYSKSMMLYTQTIPEAYYESKGIEYIKSGLSWLDNNHGGLAKGENYIIGAPTSTGKTALSLHISKCCAENGYNVLVISLEMKNYRLATRIITSNIKKNIYDKNILDLELSRIDKKYNFRLMYAPGSHIDDIIGFASNYKKLYGLDLLVIDYLQKIVGVGKIRKDQVDYVSGKLAEVPGLLDIAVICPCQMNRTADDMERPTLKTLKESSYIEQDADNVILLKSAVNHSAGEPIDYMKCYFDKSRNNNCGAFWVYYNKKYQAIKDYRYYENGEGENREL